MTKSLLLAAALLGLTVSTSFAQRGSLTLGWNDCRVHGGGIQSMTFACDTNGGSGPLLVGGFIPNASANLNSLNSAFLYLDIYEYPNLNSWWQLTDPPVTGCRSLSVWTLDMGNASGSNCDRSYWSEVGAPVSAARWFFPTYHVAHGTLRLLVAVDAQDAGQTPQIGVGEESHVFGARLGRANTTGAGACVGCAEGVNLYFAAAEFNQTNLDNFVIDGVGFPYSPTNGPRCAIWQNGNLGACPPSPPNPARNATWGSIKSLYR